MSNSLQFYANSLLSAAQTADLVATENVDGSTTPPQFTVWLGSTDATKRFQASSSPGVDNIVINITNVTPVWTAGATLSLAYEARTTAKLGYYFEVTAAGTTGGSEPDWAVDAPDVDDTVVDGSVTWTNRGPIHEATEVKLATTIAGLASAVAGDPLTLSTEILGGVGNAAEVNIEVDDATQFISTLTELQLQTVSTDELATP